ncbi:BglII/BstYI family type II restriction endonuclease [Bradyrhizobium diazoefficiens]|uniref:BglII/BstYI family type II restriction endonuclease n=1 Tax=Bradyrhizobium diazoefficiens TaxID=1355477 RepID=UPI001AEE0C07
MFDRLRKRGFEVEFRSHAQAILSVDFPEVAEQLESVLEASTIPIEEIIGSGGGETKGTQRLRRALAAHEWRKHNFVVQRIIDGVQREAQSHEIDHVRTFNAGTIALEIEWNNKVHSSIATSRTSRDFIPMVPFRSVSSSLEEAACKLR